MLQITRPYEDFSNLLLMLLKFLLIVAIGLQGLRGIVTQLGLNPEAKTGIVNATPLSQAAIDGNFRLSFYPVIYSARVDSSEVKVAARLCSENCAVDWDSLPEGLPQGQQWRDMPAGSFTFNRRDETPEEAARTLAERLHAETYSLLGQIPGTYSVVYQVSFNFNNESETHRVPQVFTVNSQTQQEGEWRLDPIRIVKGQSSPLPDTLAGFQLAADTGSQLQVRGDQLSLVRRNFRGNDFFVEPLYVQNQVGQVDTQNNFFIVGGRTIQAGQARFLRYDESSNGFLRAEFRQMNEGNRVYYEAATPDDSGRTEATLVRFAADRLPVQVPVVAQNNLPPRGIYRGSGGRSDTSVLLYFPQHSFNFLGGRELWYFDLSQHIIDPDGVRGGQPSVQVYFRNYGKRGQWPSDFDLIPDPATGGALLTFDPNTLRRYLNARNQMRVGLLVSDDGWRGAVAINITIEAAYRESMDEYKRYLPSGR